jgi:uncharacterized protein YjbI with pentapeptide repeats
MKPETFPIQRPGCPFVPACFFLLLLSVSFLRVDGQQDYSKVIFTAGFSRSNVLFPDASLFFKDEPSGHGYVRAKFLSEASFSNDVFQGKVDCRQMFFPNDINFDQTTFGDVADFTRDTFSSVANFSDAKFRGDCHFILATFNNYVDFSRASFRGTAFFSDLSLTDTTMLDFYEAILPDTLDFSANPKIPMEINLSAANFIGGEHRRQKSKKHYIFLYGSDISRFRLDYRNFALIFTDPKNGKEIDNDDKISIYESLLRNFQDRGQLQSYELLDIEFRDYQWRTLPMPIRWFYVVPHYWNYYGHETGLVFAWTLVFLMLFTLINFRYLDFLAKQVYLMNSVRDFPSAKVIAAATKGKERNHLAWERFWAAFVYTSTLFFLFSLNLDNFRFNHRRAAFYVIVVFTTGIICIAYMANFVITK